MQEILKKNFSKINGIYHIEINDASTKNVTNFYKNNPFPNYKVNDSKLSILKKGDQNPLAKQFKKFIGFNKNILEVGCGTGQLSIYFSIGTNNSIIGLDPTLESIKLAQNFLKTNDIDNVKLVNADIFDDILNDNIFDFIWCNGVLHHTKNPYNAFEIVIKSLKPGGYILVGLYNRYGRLRTLIRKFFYKLLGESFIEKIDPTLRNLKIDRDEKKSWIRDQYEHPLESLHSLDEVINWFNKNNIEYISSIPSADFDYDYQNIFEKKSKGSIFSRIFNQISMIFNRLGSDGGLFIVVGKK